MDGIRSMSHLVSFTLHYDAFDNLIQVNRRYFINNQTTRAKGILKNVSQLFNQFRKSKKKSIMQPLTNVKKRPYVTFDHLCGHTSFNKKCQQHRLINKCPKKNLDKIQKSCMSIFCEMQKQHISSLQILTHRDGTRNFLPMFKVVV